MRNTPKGRNELIFEAREAKKSLREIAKMFNISHERVRQILVRMTIPNSKEKDNLTPEVDGYILSKD